MADEAKKSNIFEHADDGSRRVAPINDLLHRIDGLLGVAVYRGIDDAWIADARRTISEIRRIV